MGLLALAGAVSGAGNAVNAGLQNVQAGLIQSNLQKERDKMEAERQALHEQFLTGQQSQAFAHAESMQAGTQTFERGQAQERMGHDIIRSAQAEQNADARQQASFTHAENLQQSGFTHGENLQKDSLTAAADEKAKDRDQRGQEHKDNMGLQGKKLSLDERRLTAEEAHWKNADALAKLQYGNSSIGTVVGRDGTIYSHMKDGTAKPLIDPLTKQPVIGAKGLSDAVKALAESYEKEAQGIEKGIDPLMTPEQQAPLREQAQAARMKGRSYLGEEPPAAAKPYQIDNPFPPAAGGTTSAKMAAPKEPGTKTVALPNATQQAQMKDALVDEPKAYAPTDAIPITRETPAQAKEMLAHRQTPATPPATATAEQRPKGGTAPKEKQLGLMNAATAAIPPSAAPAKTEKAIKAGTPASPSSAMQWVDSLSMQDQEKLAQMIEDVKSGKRTRDQFITGVTALAGGMQGHYVAEGILKNLGMS